MAAFQQLREAGALDVLVLCNLDSFWRFSAHGVERDETYGAVVVCERAGGSAACPGRSSARTWSHVGQVDDGQRPQECETRVSTSVVVGRLRGVAPRGGTYGWGANGNSSMACTRLSEHEHRDRFRPVHVPGADRAVSPCPMTTQYPAKHDFERPRLHFCEIVRYLGACQRSQQSEHGGDGGLPPITMTRCFSRASHGSSSAR